MVAPTAAPMSPMAQAFERFHAANPAVYDTMVDIARDMIRRTGMEHIGAQALLEWTRYHVVVQTNNDEFKVNNNFSSFYSRLIAIQEDDLRNIFEFRRADEADAWALGIIEDIMRRQNGNGQHP